MDVRSGRREAAAKARHADKTHTLSSGDDWFYGDDEETVEAGDECSHALITARCGMVRFAESLRAGDGWVGGARRLRLETTAKNAPEWSARS